MKIELHSILTFLLRLPKLIDKDFEAWKGVSVVCPSSFLTSILLHVYTTFCMSVCQFGDHLECTQFGPIVNNDSKSNHVQI